MRSPVYMTNCRDGNKTTSILLENDGLCSGETCTPCKLKMIENKAFRRCSAKSTCNRARCQGPLRELSCLCQNWWVFLSIEIANGSNEWFKPLRFSCPIDLHSLLRRNCWGRRFQWYKEREFDIWTWLPGSDVLWPSVCIPGAVESLGQTHFSSTEIAFCKVYLILDWRS
jgi:hypothetical protein